MGHDNKSLNKKLVEIETKLNHPRRVRYLQNGLAITSAQEWDFRDHLDNKPAQHVIFDVSSDISKLEVWYDSENRYTEIGQSVGAGAIVEIWDETVRKVRITPYSGVSCTVNMQASRVDDSFVEEMTLKAMNVDKRDVVVARTGALGKIADRRNTVLGRQPARTLPAKEQSEHKKDAKKGDLGVSGKEVGL